MPYALPLTPNLLRLTKSLAPYAFILLLCACNSEEILTRPQGDKPVITLDSDDGIYTVKPGREFVIAPEFSHCTATDISWRDSDGRLVATGYEYRTSYTEIGDTYITIDAVNQAGTATEDILIECVALTPPVISLDLSDGPLVVVANTDYTFAPDLQHADDDSFSIRWELDGQLVSDSRVYTFNCSQPGAHSLSIQASNSDGTTVKRVDIQVVESKPYAVSFPGHSHAYDTSTRSTFAGRSVLLVPDTEYFQHPRFSWSIDGQTIDGQHAPNFTFTPNLPGNYTVQVTVSEGAPVGSVSRRLSRNVSQGNATARAEVTVLCVQGDEASHLRPKTSSSQATATKVFEYLPAPGQFIGDIGMLGGFSGDETNQQAANQYAASKLAKNFALSLGAFGGYLIVGFDHSVKAGEGYDFAVEGNAYNSVDGGSNEPGTVWVMQDVNGNGLPDDQWYQLRGSDYDSPGTLHDYAVTYYRPDAPNLPVRWTDNRGGCGQVEYMGKFHTQPYYYPQWVAASSYTLRGSRLAPNSSLNTATGKWQTAPYAWGYADNMGSDVMPGTGTAGKPQQVGFRIANAVDALGRSVKLQYIDFVMIQCAVQAQAGPLGEVSTEVSSITSCR